MYRAEWMIACLGKFRGLLTQKRVHADDQDPLPPTLGALYHVKGLCNYDTCLYCKEYY